MDQIFTPKLPVDVIDGARRRTSRLLSKPLYLSKTDVIDIGRKLENLLKLDIGNLNESDIILLKSTKREFLSAIDGVLTQLANNASSDEHTEMENYKQSLVHKSFRYLDQVNENRRRNNVDLVSNVTPDNISIFASEENFELDDGGDAGQDNAFGYNSLNVSQMNQQFKLLSSDDNPRYSAPPMVSADYYAPATGLTPHSNIQIPFSSNTFTTPIYSNVPSVSFVSTLPNSSNTFTNPTYSFAPPRPVTSTTYNPISSMTYPTPIYSSVPQYVPPVVNNSAMRNRLNYLLPSAPIVRNTIEQDTSVNYLLKQQLFVKPQDPFTGKAESFKSWKSLLQARMKDIKLTPFDRLQVLLNNTSGTPKDIVQDYVEASDDSITDATIDLIWDILTERYGSSVHSSNYIDKRVEEFIPIRDSEEKEQLGRLIDLCRLIHMKMSTTPALNRYNFSDGMKNLWQKLPTPMRIRWRSYGVKSKVDSGGRNPTLSVFISFLQLVYSEANDDFFCEVVCETKPNKYSKALLTQTDITDTNSPTITPEQSSFLPQASTNYFICPIHPNTNHKITDCKRFPKLSFQERKEIVWNNKLCFKCFGSHMARQCKEIVTCDKCNRGHNTLMHDESYPKYNKFNEFNTNSETNRNYDQQESKNLCVNVCKGRNRKICSKTVLVQIRHKNSTKVLKCYAIIDEQSSSSFVDPGIIRELDIDVTPHAYSLRTLSGLETDVQGNLIKDLEVKGIMQGTWYQLPPVLTNSFIPDSSEEVATPSIIAQHPHLSHLSHHFPEHEVECPVLVLLGADSGEIMHTECYGSHAPYAHKTPLGWALVGSACIGNTTNKNSIRVLKTNVTNERSFSATLSIPDCRDLNLNLFKEHEDDENISFSLDEKKFLSIMNNQVDHKDGSIKMPLPFKCISPKMPDNRSSVYYRTEVALNRVKKDSDKLDQCVKSMGVNIKKKHVERVPPDELVSPKNGEVWFLPVFAVTHKKKGKARLVFDASASFQGISLNTKLFQGPHLTNNLRSVLLRFRKGLYGITCDIEHMFYNFYLHEDHKDYLRFFWFEDNDPKKSLVQYRARVHIFGASSSPAVASFGLRYAADNTSLSDVDDAKQFILHSFYVDDGVTSVDTIAEGSKLMANTKMLLKEFNIKVHKFSASDPELLKALPLDDIADNLKHVDFDESLSQRTLGVVWSLTNDSFITKAEIPETPFTKRGVLAAVNSFYDPIGIAAPVILTGRLVQRKVIPPKDMAEDELKACNWDDPLPELYKPLWNTWKASLTDAHLLKIPRCFTTHEFGNVVRRDLHVFSDASFDAIGTVIYICSFNDDNEVKVAFVTAVSRVAPRSATSMPRLELNAALQASISSREILKEANFEIDNIQYYTDSQVVLGYLRNTTRKFSRYVARRVELILKNSISDKWNYVRTKDNPADLASRPTDPVTLAKSCWLTGPQFLRNSSKANNGLQYEEPDANSIDLPEESLEKNCLYTFSVDEIESPLKELACKTSNWKFLIGVTLRVLTFSMKLLKRVRKTHIKEIPSVKTAIDKIVLSVQKEKYPEVFISLSKRSTLPESHCLSSLTPFIDTNGVLRVGGRLKNSVPFDVAHPIFVPANHHLSTHLVRYLHGEVGHQGRHITHGYVRQQGFHLENGQKVIRDLISQCVLCRKLRGKTCDQLMADLPGDRLEMCPPFTNTGLDVFGPLYVHDGKSTRRTSATKKLFVLLLTCLVTRAVHLEPLAAMDTSALINALRRFFAIRGSCRRLRSDHGSNFIGAINQSQVSVDVKKLQDVSEAHQCEWLLNPPYASHFGGAWERKIGSVRRVLEGTLEQVGKRPLSRDEMITFLQEAASVVNSTPLYEVSYDPNDASPITPNCLLTLKDHPQPPPLETFSENDLMQYGTKRWRRVQYLADQFWSRWRTNYMSNLSFRRKWKLQKPNLKVGDIVLLRTKSSPRNQWPTGIVKEVKLSADNLVRSVILAINGKQFERKIQDLVLLISKMEETV